MWSEVRRPRFAQLRSVVRCVRPRNTSNTVRLIDRSCALSPVFHCVLITTVNHSCDPNAAFNLSGPDQAKWHVRALKRITAGEPGKQQLLNLISAFSLHGGADPPFDATSSLVTCFYPNTEWVMDRPFICICGASVSYHAMRIRHRFHPPPSLVCGALKVRQSFPKKNYLLAAQSVPGSLMRYDSGTSPNAMCVIKP
jgi:hypothetical protein